MFYDSNPWVFFIIVWHQYFFLFENKGAQLFLIRVIFWILILKMSCVLRGKIVVSLENKFWLPKSDQSAQTVENSHSFFNVSYTWYKSLLTTFLHIIINFNKLYAACKLLFERGYPWKTLGIEEGVKNLSKIASRIGVKNKEKMYKILLIWTVSKS